METTAVIITGIYTIVAVSVIYSFNKQWFILGPLHRHLTVLFIVLLQIGMLYLEWHWIVTITSIIGTINGYRSLKLFNN